MARSKVRRPLSLDGDVSQELTVLAEATGLSFNELASQALRDGLRRRRELLTKQAEAGAIAGIATATMYLFVVVPSLLAALIS